MDQGVGVATVLFLFRSRSITPLEICPRVYPLLPSTPGQATWAGVRSNSLSLGRRHLAIRNKWKQFEKKVFMVIKVLKGIYIYPFFLFFFSNCKLTVD